MAKFCTDCGKPIVQGANFCIHCGASIETAPQETTVQPTSTIQHTYPQTAKIPPKQNHIPQKSSPKPKPQKEDQIPTETVADTKARIPGRKRALTVLFALADIALIIACINIIPERMEKGALPYIPKVLQEIELVDEESSESEEIIEVKPNSFLGFWDTEPLDDEQNSVLHENTSGSNEISTPYPSSYSTTERPELDDFDWYIDNDYMGFLSAGALITDFESVSGGWKAMLYFDPDNANDSCGFEIVNAVISGNGNDAVLTIKWHELHLANGSSYNETVYADSEFYGSMNSGKLTFDGDAKIKINGFYQLDNKEYAVGTVEIKDGTPTFFAMVRP